MFYLKHFFKIVIENPFRGFLFLALSLCLLSSFIFEKNLSKTVSTLLSSGVKEEVTPHFFALLEGELSESWVIRKVSRLPGVKSVVKTDPRKLNNRLQALNGELSVDLPVQFANSQFYAFKISLIQTVEKRSVNLIKEYLGRLVGDEKVTTTVVRGIGTKSKKKTFSFAESTWLIQVIASFLWGLSFLSMFGLWKKESYYLETYQRKKMISFKMVGSFQLLCTVMALLVQYSLNVTDTMFIKSLIPLSIMFACCLTLLKEWKWEG